MDGKNFDELTRKLARVTNRRSLLRGLAGGAVALVGLRGSEALAGKEGKTTICHATSSASNPWVQITVNDNSLLPAHYGHGDFNVTSAVACCRDQDCKQPSNPCQETVCNITNTGKDTAASTCVTRNKANGSACDDGNACTTGDTCQTGVCKPGTAKVCTALDQCHDVGVCDKVTGICSNPNKANGTSCNDDNLCTTGETCQAGVCSGGTPKSCPASDQCHLPGTCDTTTGLCSNPAKTDGTACDDGNACTVGDTCQAGTCTAGTAKTCPTPDQCHDAGICDPKTGDCSNPAKADGTACDDLNLCTTGDTCQGGVCKGTEITCTASDQCHDVGVCDHETGKCTNPAKQDGASCSDDNACTTTDICVAGVCTGTEPVDCPPLDQCHEAGICNAQTGKCEYQAKPNGTACDDGDLCTQTDTCQAGACVGGNPVTCSASDQCHDIGICNPATGVCSDPAKPDNTPCDDGDLCTQTDTCQAGTCVGGNPVTCSASDQCHVAGECIPATGQCTDPAAVDGTTCDDHNACTKTDTCVAGTCVGGDEVVCSAKDQCHVAGVCDQQTGVCSNPDAGNGTACNDGNACTQTDTCFSGVCTGGNPVICPAPDQCHNVGTCDQATGICSNPAKADGSACNDGNACTQTDTCQAGACVGGNPVTCSASDQCHVAGTCNPATGTCDNPTAPNGTPCDDGNACTTNDICQNGTCVGTPVACNTANCETCVGGTCVGCATGTVCDAGTCVVPSACAADKCNLADKKCCCFNPNGSTYTCANRDTCDKDNTPSYCIF